MECTRRVVTAVAAATVAAVAAVVGTVTSHPTADDAPAAATVVRVDVVHPVVSLWASHPLLPGSFRASSNRSW
jgi:hypothetical protein